jgi:hypothetical protein
MNIEEPKQMSGIIEKMMCESFPQGLATMQQMTV